MIGERRSPLTICAAYVVAAFSCAAGFYSAKPPVLSQTQAERVVGGAPVSCLDYACLQEYEFGSGQMTWYYHKYLAKSAEIVSYNDGNRLETAADGTTSLVYYCTSGTPHCIIGSLTTPATSVTNCTYGPVTVTKYKCE